MKRCVLAFSETPVDARDEQILVVPVEEPLSLRCLQLRHYCNHWFDVLSAGVVDGSLLRLHGHNVLGVVWTEIVDLRSGPLDETQGVWPLVPRNAQRGDYLAAWVRNHDCSRQYARGHFVVGDPT